MGRFDGKVAPVTCTQTIGAAAADPRYLEY